MKVEWKDAQEDCKRKDAEIEELREALEAVMTELIAADREGSWPYKQAEKVLSRVKG